MVLDCITNKVVDDFSRLPSDLGWVLSEGINDRRLIGPQGSRSFTSPTWYQLDEQGVWFAKGGYSQSADSATKYWVGLWAKGEIRPKVVYSGKHTWTPTHVTVSRDGRIAASADRLGEIHLWDTRTAETLRVFEPAAHADIWGVTWSEDGKTLYFADQSHRTGEFVANNYGPLNKSFDLERRVRGEAATVQIPREPNLVGDFKPLADGSLEIDYRGQKYRYQDDWFGKPTCYRFLPVPVAGIQDLVAVGSESGQLVILALDSGKVRVLRKFLGHHAFVTAAAQSPDGQLLASSSIDGTIRIWSLNELERVAGDIDFQVRGNQVLRVPPGSETQRVGIAAGDRIMRVNGMSFYESRREMVRGTMRAGQSVKLSMKSSTGNPYSTGFVLQASPTHIEPLLSLQLMKQREWVLWSPHGFYDASALGDRFVGWHVNRSRTSSGDFYKAHQFASEMYRPKIIDAIWEQRDADRAIESINVASVAAVAPTDYREAERFEQLQPPTVSIASPRDGFVVASGRIRVLAEVLSESRAAVTKVRIAVNGLESVWSPASEDALSDNDVEMISQHVQLQPGENTITVVAHTIASESKPVEVRVTYKPKVRSVLEQPPEALSTSLPHLYVLSVGIGEYLDGDHIPQLDYAHLDAQDFANAWQQQNGVLYNVHTTLLRNNQATSGEIRDAIDELLGNSPSPSDLVVILFSGHGVYDARGNYYLATHDTRLDKLRRTAIPHSELNDLVSNDLKHCRRILFVDTCHGGGALGPAGVGDPWKEFGAVVFASSHWREQSLEHDDWQNGALVEAFLEAMRKPIHGLDHAAQIVEDEVLSAKELSFYLEKRIPRLTNNRQHAATKFPFNLMDFEIARRIKE